MVSLRLQDCPGPNIKGFAQLVLVITCVTPFIGVIVSVRAILVWLLTLYCTVDVFLSEMVTVVGVVEIRVNLGCAAAFAPAEMTMAKAP